MKQKGILACIVVMFLFLLSAVPSVQAEEACHTSRLSYAARPDSKK